MSCSEDAVKRRVADDSASGLLSRLLDDATALVRNEIALAKSEFHEMIGNIKTAIGAMGMAAAILVAALLTLVAAAVLALAQVVEPWLAALIIGALLGVVGMAMLSAARKTLASPETRLDQTQKSLRADAAVVARRTS
jgi:hypothetical protein